MKPRFIVLEGIDGAGTTTQTEALAQRLRERGQTVLTTREPSTGPVGLLIRQALEHRLTAGGEPTSLDWKTLALLFAADRADHAARLITPALAAGSVVICDRYDLSSCIYQSLTAPEPGLALTWVAALNSQVPRPDRVFVLDVPPEVAHQRRHARGGEPELFERNELQILLAKGYEEAEKYTPGDRLIHVRGDRNVTEITDELAAFCEA